MDDLTKLKKKYEDGGKAEKIKGLAKSLQGEASIGPIPRSKAAEFMGDKVAGAFRSARNAMSAEVPLVGGTVGEWLIGEAPEALEDWSYGFGPVRLGRTDVVGPAGALYGMKADPRILDVAGAAELGLFAGSMGRKATAKAADKLMQTIRGRKPSELDDLQKKYQGGGRVGRFFSAVDKAIDVLKQKKGTGEQILKQLETTPGVKQEELEVRGIKQKLQQSPKITQEELKRTAQRNKAPIPQRKVLGAGVPEDYKPEIPATYQKLLDEYGIEPVVNPEDGRMMAFHHRETGEIASGDILRTFEPDELGIPLGPNGKLTPEAAEDYRNLKRAIDLAEKQFQADLNKYNPKFQRYSQPGGENYREVLVHLPEGASAEMSMKRSALADILNGRTLDELPQDARFEAMMLMDDLATGGNQFVGSHYDVPNILTHFRVSDRIGPNGEKVLFVDEIQSDWHQRARDARKSYIKDVLANEKSLIREKAIAEMVEKGKGTEITDANQKELDKIVARLTRERKAELDKAVPKDFGYRTGEDVENMTQLREKMNRIRNDGMSPDEIAEYFQPGKIVKGYGGYDKVISFNAGEGTPTYLKEYERAMQRALSTGVDEESARQWATKKALEASKSNWSVTVIEVDPRTGQPKRGAQPRTHMTSPEDEVVRDLSNQFERLNNKVPDAPFKDTWHELAVKEIMDMASKEGYDKVAFSPGIEQVKRYTSEMRQAVDEIRFVPGVDEDFVAITGIKGGKSVFTGRLENGVFVNSPAKGKTLSEVFGSNIANQIDEQLGSLQQLPAVPAKPMPKMSADELLLAHGDEMTQDQRSWLNNFVKVWEESADDPRTQINLENIYDAWTDNQTLGKAAPPARGGSIKGDDLAIGGEGMKSFYDKRLPDYVRKYAGKEFDAKTDYLDIKMTPDTAGGAPSESRIREMMNRIDDAEDDELMERVMDLSYERVNQELARRGISPNSPEYNTAFDDFMYGDALPDLQQQIHEQALRQLAIKRLQHVTPGTTMRAFTVDVTPKMRERITTEGQRLYAAAPPVVGLGVAQTAFDPEGSDYDYESAKAAGMGPEATGENQGHWGSVTQASPEDRKKYGLPDDSYMLLKGRKHETWNLAEQAEKERGAEIVRRGNRYFSVPRGSLAQEPSPVSPEAPEGFQSGGRVGLVKKAAEKLSGALRETQEQRMLQGLYRGYAGDYDAAKAAEASGLIYATPQRRAAENYANRRSQTETRRLGQQADPHVEMLLVDPFAGRKYGHSVMTKASEEPIITQARELKPEDIESVTQLKKRGGLAQAFPKSL